ncbi:hypothetical protein P23_1091 [Acinetobacter calcoaceticus]|nr:hypothetical protein P23_1091 [Acinetobacter calcoaceticus]
MVFPYYLKLKRLNYKTEILKNFQLKLIKNWLNLLLDYIDF